MTAITGLMQDWPLTLDKILDHARTWHGQTEIVSRSIEGPIVRTTYARIHERARRLSSALAALGVEPGDRVATLAWNTGRHLETWYGVMGMGAICHTLNPRLHPDQLCYVINHAADKVVVTDLGFLPTLLARRGGLPTVRHVVVLTDEAHLAGLGAADVLAYERLIASHPDDCVWGGFDENAAAGLCYTSGTTGAPKGVLYSHRSNFLHTLTALSPDAFGLRARDVILPVVPMYHANAWGVAFAAPAVGAKLVLPGQKLDGASLYELMETEGVTFAAGVPTVWQTLLAHVRETGARFSSLQRVAAGGAAVPEAIIRSFRDDYGVEVLHAWGMTETSPVATVAAPTAAVAALPAEGQLRYRLKQGRPPLGVELKLTDEEGRRLPHDGRTFGRLMVKGPFVARAYLHGEGEAVDAEGFFDTGDVATIDADGFMQITDRAKDVIKSGGEWISSIEIENLAMGHPKAELAAVVGVVHPKWDERPVLVVKLRAGETAEAREFLDFLEGRIAKWWMPDAVVFVEEIPLGATGKIDKKVVRERIRSEIRLGA